MRLLSLLTESSTAYPTLVPSLRESALSQLRLLKFPTRQEEAWRYTSVQTLLDQDFTFPPL